MAYLPKKKSDNHRNNYPHNKPDGIISIVEKKRHQNSNYRNSNYSNPSVYATVLFHLISKTF